MARSKEYLLWMERRRVCDQLGSYVWGGMNVGFAAKYPWASQVQRSCVGINRVMELVSTHIEGELDHAFQRTTRDL